MFEDCPNSAGEEYRLRSSKSWKMHREPDGIVLGTCITGSCSKDSLVTWIKYLMLQNPHLKNIPVVFTLRNPAGDVDLVDYSDVNKHTGTL